MTATAGEILSLAANVALAALCAPDAAAGYDAAYAILSSIPSDQVVCVAAVLATDPLLGGLVTAEVRP